MSYLITAKRWHDVLAEAGVIREDDHVSRVVIDAKLNEAVRIYVERIGDSRLLQLIPTLDGIEVTYSDAATA